MAIKLSNSYPVLIWSSEEDFEYCKLNGIEVCKSQSNFELIKNILWFCMNNSDSTPCVLLDLPELIDKNPDDGSSLLESTLRLVSKVYKAKVITTQMLTPFNPNGTISGH